MSLVSACPVPISLPGHTSWLEVGTGFGDPLQTLAGGYFFLWIWVCGFFPPVGWSYAVHGGALYGPWDQLYRLGCLVLGLPFLNEPETCGCSLLVMELEEPYRLWEC